MKKITSQTFRIVAFGLLSISLLLSSCDNEETPTFTDPTIGVTTANTQQMPGGKVTFTIAVAAEAGLASVKQGDTEIKTYSVDTKTDIFTYEFTIPASQALGTLAVPFTVIDKQGEPKSIGASADITVTAAPKETVVVDASIAASATWVASKFYLLKGNIYVQSGAELTIEPGTIIFGDKVTKGALIVSRGAKIHAKGTAEKPIVFTSSAPKTFRNYGDWGGIVLLGKAANNQSVNQTIEGISAASGDNGLYGGTADDDNSGELYYARIEFAGIALSTDNELNGVTFGSVGSGTEIHHIQVSYSGDDSYEWFGGAVNTKYLVAYRGWDDEFDTDFGYRGNNQFLVSFRDPNIADKSGSNGFESDNNAQGDDKTPLTAAKFSNVTFFGPYAFANLASGALSASNVSSNYKRGAHIRRNSALQVYNSVFVGANIDGILFENTNSAAVFKGNYLGRFTGAAKPTPTAKVNDPYVDANFAADNSVESPVNKVDLSATFAGLAGVGSLGTPNPLLAGSSTLLTGAVTVPAGLTQVTYKGAFDATTNWMAGWTSFDPINVDYGN
ncbi:MAG TPA: hypothetical protein VK508_11845 [Cyclobacteriaceae bacterium]|nr:hypothetical protein [Cyclobacteriaceae bacterium]